MKSLRESLASLRYARLIILLVATAPATLWAQDEEGPTMISVRLVDVKSDTSAEWQAAAAEIAAAYEAAGRPFFHVYERLRGPNLPTFSVVTLDAEFNELPSLEIDESVIDRIQSSQNGSELMVLAIDPALSISSGSVAPSGEFMSVRVRTVAPSNRQAYYDWHADELTPAARESGITDLRAGRRVLGGNTNTFVRFYYGDSVQSAPGGGGTGIAGAMDPDDFERMIAREAALLVADEQYVYRFRDDLSYTAEE